VTSLRPGHWHHQLFASPNWNWARRQGNDHDHRSGGRNIRLVYSWAFHLALQIAIFGIIRVPSCFPWDRVRSNPWTSRSSCGYLSPRIRSLPVFVLMSEFISGVPSGAASVIMDSHMMNKQYTVISRLLLQRNQSN